MSLPPSVSTSKEIDFMNCSLVDFESRDGVPGVNYETGEGDTGWIPVKAARRGHPCKPKHPSESSDSDDETLHIPEHAQVNFLSLNGTPGLRIGSASGARIWTPIAARTRFKRPQNDYAS